MLVRQKCTEFNFYIFHDKLTAKNYSQKVKSASFICL